LLQQLDSGAVISVWLKVDTGMGRLGFAAHQVPEVLRLLTSTPAVSDISLMTHLANADSKVHPLNKQQLAEFKHLSSSFEFKEVSILNSAGILNFADACESVVRPGMMLYGVSPFKEKCGKELGLRPAMTLKSQLISVKTVESGASIGYGSRDMLERTTQIGIVSCGYGDGYPRHAISGTPVVINGSTVPLIGRVSMDMIAVDLGEMHAAVGDEVVLWGDSNPVEVVAEFSDTIGYELVCGILPRVKRLSI
jgi:alanine racemase